MAFCWTSIHVKDFEASIRFYESTIGLRVLRREVPRPGVAIAFMGFGADHETQLELIHGVNEGIYPPNDLLSLGFTVDGIHSKKKMLDVSGIQTSEIIQPSPTIQFFFIKDPDGVTIQFVEFDDVNRFKDI